MTSEELGNIINFMLTDCPEREEAESAYLKIAETSPFTLFEYHFMCIAANIQNQNAILRSLTLLKQLFQHFENFELANEQHQFIQEKLIEFFANEGLNETNRNLLTNIIDSVQQAYNREAVAQQGELLWPSIFIACQELSNSENDLIAYSSIKLIAQFIKFGSYPITPNLEFLQALLSNNFARQEATLRTISSIELVLAIHTEIKTFSEYAEYILNIFPSIPHNRAKLYCSAIFNLKNIGFFFHLIPQLISIFSAAIQDDNYSVDVRVTIMEILGMYIDSDQVLQNNPAEVFFELVQALFVVLTTIETDENKYLSTSAKSLLGHMSKKIDLDEFDNRCIEFALESIGKEEWQFRFAGISLIHSICSHINDENVKKIAEFLREYIQEPVPQSRKVVYKIMKVIAKKKRDLYDSELSILLFPLLLEAIPAEIAAENEENVVYAFSVLSVFCTDSQTDTLGQYAETILQLCFECVQGSSEPMLISILKCIGSLCCVMETNIHQFIQPITEFLKEASKVESVECQYQTVMTIYECLDLCENNAEKANFSQFGLLLFNNFNWEQTSEEMRLDLFKAFRSFAKNLDPSNVPPFDAIIEELLRSSSEHVHLNCVDDVDYSLLPKKYAVIRLNEKILVVNTQEIRDIAESLEILSDFVHDFPEYFVNKKEAIFQIISKQIEAKSTFQMVSSLMLLFKTLIEHCEVLHIPVGDFIIIMQNFIGQFETEKSLILLISIMKYFILKIREVPVLIMEVFNLSVEILKRSYNNQDEIYEEFAQIPQGDEYEADNMKDQIESAFDNEKLIVMELTKFYLFFINKFPEFVTPEFLHNLIEMYSEDKPSRFKLPGILINVKAESFGSKNYMPHIGNLDKYINENYPEECEFVMEVINIITQDSVDPNVLGSCLELISKMLQFESIEYVEFDQACNLAIYCLVNIMRKIPESASISVLQAFLHFLPITNFDFNAEEDESIRAVEIHEYFVNDIMNKKEFYKAPECLPITLTVIAKLCNSDFINEETKTTLQQLVSFLIQQPDAQPFFEAIGEKYSNRLAEFAKLSS